MAGLAALAKEAGHRVTGCDQNVYPPMSDQLRSLGIPVTQGFGAEQLDLHPDVYIVGNVVSRARRPDGGSRYPLMEAILDAGLAFTSGPQWLHDHVLQGRHVVAVAGTNGKTTTTAMVVAILEHAGMRPGFLIGGVPRQFGVSARLGAGPFVIEADEYDTAFFDKRSKFLHYRPRTLVLNNLEFDHADIFDDLSDIERQFHHLIRTIPGIGSHGSGRILVNATQESLQRVLAMGCWSEVRSFGTPTSDYAAEGDARDFAVLVRGTAKGRVQWDLSGLHNQHNALAAIAACEHLWVAASVASQALSQFQGVLRRMEVRGAVGPADTPITVYDDFAHHPTAIRTTLDGLRATLQEGERILAVFEPRSNTMKLGSMKDKLPWSLEPCDAAFCLASGLEWDAATVLSPLGNRVTVCAEAASLVDAVCKAAKPGDHIVCMSNGSFDGIHDRLLDRLHQQYPSVS